MLKQIFLDVFCKIPERFTPLFDTNKSEFSYNSLVKLKCKGDSTYLKYDGEYVDYFEAVCFSDKTWIIMDKAKCYTGLNFFT